MPNTATRPRRKTLRKIELTDWQQQVVRDRPARFLRGLFHSDGSRFTNRVLRKDKYYTYPRYTFVNESTDIMVLCRRSLDQLHVSRRSARHNTRSVARKEAVAGLDEFAGPKW